jgi:glycosyltransferase involved in cell wall biosynthesis
MWVRHEQYYCHAQTALCVIARFLPNARPVSHRPLEWSSLVHVLAPGEFGGLESVVRLMAVGQRRRGHDVVVAPILPRRAPIPAWLERVADAGVPVEPIVTAPRDYLSQWRQVARLCDTRQPRLVHTHGYHADVIGGGAARRARVPVAATVHGFVGGDRKNRFYELLQRRALRGFDAVMAVSRAMVVHLRASGISAERLHLVPNAFDSEDAALPRAEARRELGVPDDAFQLGWIGRLSPEKGADVMLRALALLPDPAVRLSILGAGAERSHLESLAVELGIAARVVWHGVQLGAPRLAAAFDAIVLSSRAEGTPIVLFEAMAAGAPIVATRVGGIPDVVTEAEAMLVPPDDPAALAAAVAAIRSNPSAARDRAAAARRRLASEFSTTSWLDRIDDVYRRAAGVAEAAPS